MAESKPTTWESSFHLETPGEKAKRLAMAEGAALERAHILGLIAGRMSLLAAEEKRKFELDMLKGLIEALPKHEVAP